MGNERGIDYGDLRISSRELIYLTHRVGNRFFQLSLDGTSAYELNRDGLSGEWTRGQWFSTRDCFPKCLLDAIEKK